jgi:hypothetical protein
MMNFRWLVRRAAWVLVLLLLLGVVAWTVGNMVGTSHFEAALRNLEAKGYPTSLSGLAPASPPPGEDAGPYYTAALALHVKSPEDPDVEWDPEPADKIAEMTPEQREKLKAWVAANQESFDMLARARLRPRCRYEHDFAQGYSMLLPEVTNIIVLSRTLRVRAVLQSLDGDVAGAQDSVRSILALGESVREEPVLVEQLVRLVTVRLAMGAVDACVSSTTSEADLKAWAELLPKDGFLDGALARAIRGEIGMLAQSVAAGPHGEFEQMMLGMGGGALLRPLVRSDAARFVDLLRRAAEASDKPYPEARVEMDRIEGDPREGRRWWRPVCNALLPGFRKSLQSLTAAKAHVAVVRAGLGAELARAKTGKAPERLETPDPFTGKPLTIDAAGKIASAESAAGVQPNNDPIEWTLRTKK